MSKPFDAATKQLIRNYPEDWLRFFKLTATEVDVIDTDLSTITNATDAVLHIKKPKPGLVHIEFEARMTNDLRKRVLLQSVLLTHQYDLPVESIVLLLRKKTQFRETTGQVEYKNLSDDSYLVFRYHIIRLWEVPVEELLSDGLGLLPLAPLSQVSKRELPGLVRRMEERIARAVTRPEQAEVLWATTYVLLGLQYDADFATTLLKGIKALKESATYQHILNEGRNEGRSEEARRTVLRIGERRFGVPTVPVRAQIEALTDIAQLERLIDRLLEVETWDELLKSTE